jgi:hypothetical protein
MEVVHQDILLRGIKVEMMTTTTQCGAQVAAVAVELVEAEGAIMVASAVLLVKSVLTAAAAQ